MTYGVSIVLINDTELNLNRQYKANSPQEVIGYFYNQIFDNKLKAYTAVSGDGVANIIPKDNIMYIKIYEDTQPTDTYEQSNTSEGINIPYIPEVSEHTHNDTYGVEQHDVVPHMYQPEDVVNGEENDI